MAIINFKTADGKTVSFKSKPSKRKAGKTMAKAKRKVAKKTVKKKNPRTALNKAVSIPKGKKAGEHFTRGGVKYVVVSYINKSTKKRIRYARKIK
ncbi:MAG: hypothetical protein F6K48_03195 [Okeania sp. SIO3H1]|nr:hypothetical protein [Okeania sp. SIO3H1]